MADIDESAKVNPVISEATLGFLLLRLWIGCRMVFAGAEKFYAQVMNPETELMEWKFALGNAAVTARENIYKVVADNQFLPLNPQSFFVKVFGVDPDKIRFLEPLKFDLWFAMALPYLLLGFGTTLILGIIPRVSTFMAGFTFLLLSIGLMSMPDNEGIASLGIHVGLCALALCLVKGARLNLTKF